MKLSEKTSAFFECVAHKIEPDTFGKLEVTEASISTLKKLIGNDEIKRSDAFSYLAGDLAVGALINKNDDGITAADAVRVYKQFEGTPIDIEHNRNKVVGYIVKSKLTDIDTKEILTDEQALAYTKPFNISIAFVVWPHVDPELYSVIEEVSQEANASHGLISLSWEMAFDEYLLLAGDKNVFAGELISDDAVIGELETSLRCKGGTGLLPDGRSVYRIVTGANLLPLGAGLVVKPAADVKGIVQIVAGEPPFIKEEDDDDDNDEPEQHKEECECEDCVEKNKEKSTAATINSLAENDKKLQESVNNLTASLNVILEKVNTNSSQLKNINVKQANMKIKSVSDINSEFIKAAVTAESSDVAASEITRFIVDELSKKADEHKVEVEAKENEAKLAKEAADAAAAETRAANERVEALSAELETLKTALAADKAESDFNSRMTALDEEFELSDEDRKVIASKIKGLDDVSFSAWKSDFDVLAKEKNKEVVKAKTAELEKKLNEVKASVDPLELIKANKDTVPSSVAFAEDVLAAYREAFSVEKGVKFVK